ncbi:MAG: hypothetical protein ACREV4_12180 [Gammaproteobacteria bacterium]
MALCKHECYIAVLIDVGREHTVFAIVPLIVEDAELDLHDDLLPEETERRERRERRGRISRR